MLDIANLRGGRALVQVLHELAQRVFIALCFASYLTSLLIGLLSGK